MEKYEGYLFVQFTSQKEGSYCPSLEFQQFGTFKYKMADRYCFF